MDLKIIKKHLSISEQVSFVQDVINTASVAIDVDNNSIALSTYLPALFDFSFFINILKYFFEYEIPVDNNGEFDQEAANSFIWDNLVDIEYSCTVLPQIEKLKESCVQQIKLNQKRELAVLHEISKPDPLDRLIDIIESWISNNTNITKDVDIQKINELISKLGSNSITEKKLSKSILQIQKQHSKSKA